MKKEYRTDISALDTLADRWPSSMVSRAELSKFSGGLIHGRTMANRECREGVSSIPRFRMGKKIFYQVADVISFLKSEVSK